MFETIFTPYGVHRHRSAPLLLEREEFLAHLQRRGTGPVCLRAYASRLNQIVRFLNLTIVRGVGSSEIKLAARRAKTHVADRVVPSLSQHQINEMNI
jgi:hypothetical protein